MYPRFGILCFVNLTALLASDGFHRGRCCELLPRLLGAHDRSAENQTKHDRYALEDVLHFSEFHFSLETARPTLLLMLHTLLELNLPPQRWQPQLDFINL